LITDHEFLSGVSQGFGDGNLSEQEILALKEILVEAGLPRKTILLLIQLMTKRTSVIIVDPSVPPKQFKAALKVSLHFNKDVYIEARRGTKVPKINEDIRLKFKEKGLLLVDHGRPSTFFRGDENTLHFDADAFATKIRQDVTTLEFYHSPSMEILSGNTSILKILLESLVAVSRALNSKKIPAMPRALKSAA